MLLLAGLLVAAWRFDNHTGSLFMVALLFVIVMAVLALLLTLTALLR